MLLTIEQRQEIISLVKKAYEGDIDYQMAYFLIFDAVEDWYGYKKRKGL